MGYSASELSHWLSVLEAAPELVTCSLGIDDGRILVVMPESVSRAVLETLLVASGVPIDAVVAVNGRFVLLPYPYGDHRNERWADPEDGSTDA